MALRWLINNWRARHGKEPRRNDVVAVTKDFSVEVSREREQIHQALLACRREEPDSFYGKDPERLMNYYTPARIVFYAEIIKLLNLHEIFYYAKKVADIGSFLPVLLNIMATRAGTSEFHAYDLNENIMVLVKYYSDRIRMHRVDYLDQPDDTYDLIFCLEVLEHQVDPAGALSSVLTGLHGGGVCLVTVPNGRKDSLDAGNISITGKAYSGHINFWSPESWWHVTHSAVDSRKYDLKVNVHPQRYNYAVIRKRFSEAGQPAC